MLKNRTFLGVFCLVLAVVICFGLSPLIGKAFEGKRHVVMLKKPIAQGIEIKNGDIAVVEMGKFNMPAKAYSSAKDVVGKYAAANLFPDVYVVPEMISPTIDTSDSMLRALKDGETAMSVPIKNYADGLSGKLISGDVVKIVSVDDESKNPTIYEELRYIEVITATTDGGADNINALAKNSNGNYEKPVTLTLKIQNDLQALRLAECVKNGSLQAVFVSRVPEKSAELLKEQADILKKLQEDSENDKAEETAENTENQASETAGSQGGLLGEAADGAFSEAREQLSEPAETAATTAPNQGG